MVHRIDMSTWPIVVTEAVGESSDDDLDAYIRESEAALARAQPHVVILDSRQGSLMRPEHRRRVAAWIKSREAELRRWRRGLAFVSESAVLRGMLTATYWLSPPPYPHRCFARMEEAQTWARERLEAPIPAP